VLSEIDLNIYAGIYSAPSLGRVEVGVKEGRLVLLGSPPAELTQVAEHKFEGLTPVGLTTIEFVTDKTGKVIRLIAHTPNRDFEFERK